jgi:hypothetical protein
MRPRGQLEKLYVRLEVLDAKRHLAKVFDATSGNVYHDSHRMIPMKCGAFLVFRFRLPGNAQSRLSFVTTRIKPAYSQSAYYGSCLVVMLNNDSPVSACRLSLGYCAVRLGLSSSLEACYLMIDRLFAHGYRRVGSNLDRARIQFKLADRLGLFTPTRVVCSTHGHQEFEVATAIFTVCSTVTGEGARLAFTNSTGRVGSGGFLKQ